MLERPLLIPLGSLIAGLYVADLLGTTPPPWALALLILTTLAACLVKGRLPFLFSLSLVFFVWGWLSLEPFLSPDDQVGRYASDRPVLIDGVVDARPEGFSSGGARIYLQVQRIYQDEVARPVRGRLLVQVKEGRPRLATGDRIIFSSKIRRPRNYGLPGEGDYPRRLAYKSVFATAFVMEANDLLLLRTGGGWRHELDLLAASLGRFITTQAPGPEGGILKALLLGDKGDIPEEINGAYARSGVNHILSISGFHVGIIFLCIFQLLFLLARRSEFLALRLNLRRCLLLAALPVVVFYLFLSGIAPATLRSVLMIAAVIAALHVKREVDPLNSVMLAACAILMASPEVLFEVSFQLSFLAIWGLIALAPGLASPFAAARWGARWILLLVAASAAAILATFVPVAYYFHQVSLTGLLANLVIVPVMGYGAVVVGFASLPLVAVAPGLAACLVKLAAWLIRVSDSAILFFARAPVITSYAPAKLDLFIACLILCAVTFLTSRRAKSLAASLLLAVLVVRAMPAGGAGDDQLRVYFLSVGQGDATLVGLPDGKWMLVDGGGRAAEGDERVGERLLPALSRLGVKHLDYLVLTHEHPDHLQGVLYLARHFDVREVWETGVPGTSREYQELKWVLVLRGIHVRVINASMPPLEAGGARIEPLWPLSAARSLSGDANDSSLVFRLRHGSCSVLFTGDLGEGAERELLARGVPLKSSLLKVAHHGSKHSSSDDFLTAVAPKVAVISAGYDNPFHLPAPKTVGKLQMHGIRVYRTDLDGTVEVHCGPDGALSISTPWGHFN